MEKNYPETYHPIIPKKAVKDIEKFYADLQKFAEETGEKYPNLYQDANTTFQVRDLLFTYEGDLLWRDENDNEMWEAYVTENEDGTFTWDEDLEWDKGIKYWKSCLKRAKRYWAMDAETLDKIQDGQVEDTTDTEE